MTKLSTIFAASAFLSLAAAPAFAAGVTKTWVSSTTGDDTGTCQFTSPCKTFAYAITQTLAGGEIDVKDGGSYGPVTITQAISIVSEGFLAEVSVPSGGVGVTVAAGTSDKVILQGLVIDGHGIGQDGIDFNSGMSLTVENCHVRNFSYAGISLQPNGGQLYHVVDTEISGVRFYGIIVQPVNTAANGSFLRLDVHDNRNGILVGYSNVTIIESTINGNAIGIGTESGANILIGQSTVSANTTYGIQTQGGQVQSYGDNYINANATDISPTNGLSGLSRR